MQQILGMGMKGTGIVATLIIAGIMLQGLNLMSGTGQTAVKAGVGIGIILGLLGIVSVAKRVIG